MFLFIHYNFLKIKNNFVSEKGLKITSNPEWILGCTFCLTWPVDHVTWGYDRLQWNDMLTKIDARKRKASVRQLPSG